jgi:hypothetical protein
MKDWNKAYRESETRLFGSEPVEYLREVMARSDVTPQSALCLADGDGRNGTWLARQGLTVTATDGSDVATEMARAHDSAAGVSVERTVADLATWTNEGNRTWDLVTLFYLQCEELVRQRALSLGAAALSPGGWLVAEGFGGAHNVDDAPGPKTKDLRYVLDSIRAALPGLTIVEAMEGVIRLNEGSRHQGAAPVVRVLARKTGIG